MDLANFCRKYAVSVKPFFISTMLASTFATKKAGRGRSLFSHPFADNLLTAQPDLGDTKLRFSFESETIHWLSSKPKPILFNKKSSHLT